MQAQSPLILSIGADIPGLSHGYQFREKGAVLNRGGAGYYEANFTYFVKLRYKIGRYFALEGSFSRTEYDLGVHDKQYLAANNLPKIPQGSTGSTFAGQPGYLGAYRYYNSLSISAYGFIPIYKGSEYMSADVYFATGLIGNWRTKGEFYTNIYNNLSQNEELKLVTRYSPFFTSGYGEAGISINSRSGIVYNLGFKYVFGGPMMQADYTDIANGVLINSDHVTATAGYFGFTLNIGYTLPAFKKRKKTPEHVEKQPEVIANAPEKGGIKVMDSRPVEIAKNITVKSDSVTLAVWDDGTVDGDKVSLSLNGEWILTEHELTTEKYLIAVVLKPGINTLVLYTENEGTIKPCTIAVEVNDRGTKQFMVLRSSLKKSSSLLLEKEE